MGETLNMTFPIWNYFNKKKREKFFIGRLENEYDNFGGRK
jgi:hypothetical protein